VQDGGSTDGSRDILRRYAGRLTHWESGPDGGQAAAVNRGFRRTDGDVLAYLNSDDLLLPGTLHYVAKYFADHPDVDVVYGHRILIDEADREIGRWVLPAAHGQVLLWADYIPQETLFWRRSIWERVGAALDESFAFALDWDLLLRFRAAGARFARLPRFLGAFRVHDRQKTATIFATVGTQEIDRLWRRHHGRPVSRMDMRCHVLPYLCLQALYQQLYRLGLLRY
jgi:glycosyltransferase involved in cell wall biosynthesis